VKWFLALSLSLLGAAQASTQAAVPTYPPCARSSDIDGKGTYQLMGSGGWIFESHEFQQPEPLNSKALASLKLLAQVLKAHGSNLILVPVPSRAMHYGAAVDLTQYPQLDFSPQSYQVAWTEMIRQVRQTGVFAVDLLPSVLSFVPGARGEDFYYPRDHHWTLSGIEVATALVAAQISSVAQAQAIELEREHGTLSVRPRGEFVGAIGRHYQELCGVTVAAMQRYDTTFAADDADLLGDTEPVIGIFGDSFGLTYPDNNYLYPDTGFGVLLEASATLPTVNNAVSGSGKTAGLAGYLADPEIRAHLPKFLVVPFMGSVSNNTFDYGQMTAALLGCSADTTLAKTSYTGRAARSTFAPGSRAPVTGMSVLHIHTDAPANYLEVREGRYTDGSELRFEIFRIAADYYAGSRTDFYTLLPSGKSVQSLVVQLAQQQPITGYVEWCALKN
jgi:alginate biosynthesis protein AlgX